MPKINLAEDVIPTEILDALSVELRDFDNALKRVQPSAMREVMVEAPHNPLGRHRRARCGRRPPAAKASSFR